MRNYLEKIAIPTFFLLEKGYLFIFSEANLLVSLHLYFIDM